MPLIAVALGRVVPRAWCLVVLLAACGAGRPTLEPNAPAPAPSAVPEDDEDGVPLAEDLCPCEAEDRDGFADEDGCPDHDDDADRMVDRCDLCPRDPETWNGFDDGDGCPDRGVTIVEGDANATASLEPIPLAPGVADLPPPTLARLDAIAREWASSGAPIVVASLTTPEEREGGRLARLRGEAARARLVHAGVLAERIRVVVVVEADTCSLEVRPSRHAEAPPVCDPLPPVPPAPACVGP